jgi:drug/metabolite transporter (DMT)-like permease
MLKKDFFKNMTPQKAAYVGCLSLCFGMFMFGIGNALIKEASETLPSVQVVLLRSCFSVSYMFIFLLLTGNLKWLKSHNYPLQITRGVVGFFGLWTLFISFKILPMPEATTFTFLSPFVITALAGPLLKEKVSPQRWIAVLVGFSGVLIVAQPTGDVTLYGAGIAITSAIIEGFIMLMARLLKKDKPVTSVFFHTGIIAIIAFIYLFFSGEWVSPSAHNILTVASLGLASCLGHVSIVYAYSIAPAAVVAPMLYTLIIWGAVFGYFIWGETISTMMFVGVPLIVGSGIYIVRREKIESAKHTPEIELG